MSQSFARPPSRAKPRNLYVRCQGDDEYVVVPTNDLPDNVYDLIHLLRLETAPRSCWLDVAAAYFRAEKWKAGITVLEEATSEDVENILAGADEGAASSKAAAPCSRLDLLAALSGAHVMMAGASAQDPAARAEALSKAADVLSRADKIDLDDPAIWAARGWADLHAAKPSAASWLENARDRRAIGAIGLAALQLARAKPPSDPSRRDGPVTLLVEALRSDICPPGVWTGLAYALFRDARFRDVRNVARRALAALRRSPPAERLEALYLLALVETADKQAGSVQDMVHALQEAYTRCGGNHDARILALIANMYFNGGDFGTAESFARRAVAAASNLPPPSVGNMFAHIHHSAQIDALFQLARAQHHLGKIEDATAGFERIKKLAESPEAANIRINPGVFLRLGLLKLSTGRKEDEALAKECLEKVLKGNDRCGIAKRALGVLLGREVLLTLRKGRARGGDLYDRAVSLLSKGLDENAEAKKDIPAQLVYASLVEETYPKRAVAAYRKVIETLEDNEEEIEPEVWSNYSSILARTGEYDEADKVVNTKIDEDYAADCMTIVYNKGRIAEMLGRDAEAEKLYKEIPNGSPNHHEGLVRRAIMLMKSPNGYAEAEKLLLEARDSQTTRTTAVVFLSKLYSIQQRYKPAQDALESATNDSDYVTLAFASFMHRFLNGLEEERRNRFLVKHIGSHLQQLLARNKHNACAANGVGVYFAENKQYNEAREAFSTAGSGPNPEKVTRVNLANVQIMIGRRDLVESARVSGRPSQRARTAARSLFEQADKLFSDALSMTKMQLVGGGLNNYCELLLYSAWAKFESEDYRGSTRTLGRLVHLMPQSFMAWFNLALALMESAVKRVVRGSTRLEEISTTKRELEGARAAMHRHKLLKTQTDSLTGSYIRSAATSDMDRFIWMEIKSQDVLLRNARMKEEDRVAKREASARELERYHEMQKEKQRRIVDEQKRKEDELRRAFAESERRRIENEETHQRMLAAKKEDTVEDEEMVDGEATPGKKKKRKKQPKAEEGVFSDDEFGEEKRSKKRKKRPSPSPEKRRKKQGDSSSEYSDGGDDGDNGDFDAVGASDRVKEENGMHGSDGGEDANGKGQGEDEAGENDEDGAGKQRRRMKVEDDESE